MTALASNAHDTSMRSKRRRRVSPPARDQCLLLILVIRRLEVPGLVFLGGKHGEAPGLLELLDVVAGDAVILGHHYARRGPFAVLGESDLADVGVERVRVD